MPGWLPDKAQGNLFWERVVMIQIIKKTGDTVVELANYEEGSWVNVISPTNNEKNEIAEDLNIPVGFLSDPLDPEERSRVEFDEDMTLILVRVPYHVENSEVPFQTIPVGIILKPNYIITVASRNVEVLGEFVSGSVKNFNTSNKERFVLQFLFRVALSFLKCLREINNMTNVNERELHKSHKNKELVNLLHLEKSLVYFTTSLRTNELMIGRLAGARQFCLSEDDKEFMEDVVIEYRQALEMANIYSNILSGLMDAYASVISNNVNQVMKVLTSITILLMIPTLATSTYGMNIKLPFQEHPQAFLIVVGGATGIAVLGAMFLVTRKWF